jgi:FkbM family methyltransferase
MGRNGLRSRLSRILRSVLPHGVFKALSMAWAMLHVLVDETARFGLQAALTLMWVDISFRLRRSGRVRETRRRSLVRLRLRGYPHPIFIRRFSSDCYVVRQVFSEQQYQHCALSVRDGTVIDCGANIGCSALYFLNKWPVASVIAIEPDSENAALCQKNLAPYGERATTVQAAIWSCGSRLRVARGEYRDGLEWSHQTVPCRSGEMGDTDAVTIADVVTRFNLDAIDLLKVDIEGAEAEVFSGHCDSWLALTRGIAIELHGPECEAAVFRALNGYHYHLERHGEVTYLHDLKPAVRL